MAFLATRFTPQHRKLGRRRRRVRAEVFAADLATVLFLADNLEPEPVCVTYWRRIWVAASAAPQQTVLRRLNTKHPPGKGPFAVRAAPMLSPWLPSVAPGSPGGGGRGVGFRGARCRRRPPLLPALPGGPGKLPRGPRRPPGHARVGYLPWLGCGVAEHHHLLFLQHTGAGPAPATPATSLPQPP